MLNNVEDSTQAQKACFRNMVVCVIVFSSYITPYQHRDFTCIHQNLNALKHSVELCLAPGGKT